MSAQLVHKTRRRRRVNLTLTLTLTLAGYCCYVIPCFGQQCCETASQLPSGEFGVFFE